MGHRTCPVCESAFRPVTNQQFCSDQCRDSRRCSVSGCAKPPRSRGLCKNHYYAFRTHGDPSHGRPCVICGAPMPTTQGTNPVCGPSCRAEQEQRRYVAYRQRNGRLRVFDVGATCVDGGCHNLIVISSSKNAPRRCDACLAPGRARAFHNRMKRYGIDSEQYEAMLRDQGGRCAVCRTDDPGGKGSWHIDHDHACCPDAGSCGRCVRGLLCSGCNTAAGLLGDDPERVDTLADYLRRTRRLRLTA